MFEASLRLRCRCCGIAAADVGFTSDGEDLLCDECEQLLGAHLDTLNWGGFMRERVARAEADEAARYAAMRARTTAIHAALGLEVRS